MVRRRSSEPSNQAQAATCIRRDLKAAFPSVTFRVTSKGFSGGDSVDVHWWDGPTLDQVNAIIRHYQYGHFDGMIDLYEYSNDRADIPQSKYVHGHRQVSLAAYQALADLMNRRYAGWAVAVQQTHPAYSASVVHSTDAQDPYSLRWHSDELWQAFSKTCLVCLSCYAATLPDDTFCPMCGDNLTKEPAGPTTTATDDADGTVTIDPDALQAAGEALNEHLHAIHGTDPTFSVIAELEQMAREYDDIPPPVSGGDHDPDACTLTVDRSTDKGRTWITQQHGAGIWPRDIPTHATTTVSADDRSVSWCERDGRTLVRFTYKRPCAPEPNAPTTDASDAVSIAPEPPRCQDVVLVEACFNCHAPAYRAEPRFMPLCDPCRAMGHAEIVNDGSIPEYPIEPPDVLTRLQEQADFARTLVESMPRRHDCDQWATMPFSRVFAGDLDADDMRDNLLAYLDQLAEVITDLTEERDDLARDIESAGRVFSDALLFKDADRLRDAYRELVGDFPRYAVPQFAA